MRHKMHLGFSRSNGFDITIGSSEEFNGGEAALSNVLAEAELLLFKAAATNRGAT